MEPGTVSEPEKDGWNFSCNRCEASCFLRSNRFWGKYAILVIRKFQRKQQPVNSSNKKSVLRRAMNFALVRPDLRYRLVTLIGKFPCLDRYLRTVARGLDQASEDALPCPLITPQRVGSAENPGQDLSGNLPLRARRIYQELQSALPVDKLEGDL